MAVSLGRRVSSRKDLLRSKKVNRHGAFQLGWDHGYWYGQCESVLKRTERVFEVRPIHVLFVATGKGFPYSPLDEAISSTLRKMVSQLTVTDTTQNVSELAKQIRPDIVIVLDGLQFDIVHADEMRRAGIRTAIWFTDDPYYTDITGTLAPHYDYVFTLEKTCVELYRQLGCPRVHYLPLGAHPVEFRPRNPKLSQRHDVCFVGSAYVNRLAFFDQITRYLSTKDTLISGIWWERLKDFDLIASKVELGRWMGPAETADIYNGAKIVINMHRAHDDETFNNNSAAITAISPNPRTFEISACATLQLTDIRSDLPSFYTPDVDIVTYSSPQEMVDKIEYYLNHEAERREIAMRGLYRTMNEHTYERRLDEMFAILFPGPLLPL
ncbi:CgeB family protein [Paenibacillus nasutitermitis]|uniref:Spore maturation protein n=1 Tax=Paenibacillus nasutitermitis TaxID=1652958 RepID=A0A917DLI3_9BACL|nr:glycosyltransferase [Paenibacillus nasutitermitis]GGD49910.1 spore maturation protein [Paenibacillus nasutitermitis]